MENFKREAQKHLEKIAKLFYVMTKELKIKLKINKLTAMIEVKRYSKY